MPGVLQAVHGLIVVCEPRPFWVPALQRELHAEPFRVRGCRLPNELSALVSANLPTILICDLESGAASCLNWLASRQTTAVPTIINGSQSTAGLETVCRELGAWSFIPDLIPAGEMAALCRRWLRLLGPS